MNTLVDLILELRVPLSNQRAKVLEYFAPAAAKTRLTTFLGCILRLLNSKLSCFLFSQFRWRRVFFFYLLFCNTSVILGIRHTTNRTVT